MEREHRALGIEHVLRCAARDRHAHDLVVVEHAEEDRRRIADDVLRIVGQAGDADRGHPATRHLDRDQALAALGQHAVAGDERMQGQAVAMLLRDLLRRRGAVGRHPPDRAGEIRPYQCAAVQGEIHRERRDPVIGPRRAGHGLDRLRRRLGRLRRRLGGGGLRRRRRLRRRARILAARRRLGGQVDDRLRPRTARREERDEQRAPQR